MFTLLGIFIWLLGSFVSYAFASRVVPFILEGKWTDIDRNFGSVLSLVTSWGLLVVLIIFAILKVIAKMIENCPPFKDKIYNLLKMLEPKDK